MDSLNNVLQFIPDSISGVAIHGRVISNSYHGSMTFDNLAVICATIVICLTIIVVVLWSYSVKVHKAKLNEVSLRLEAEKEKRVFDREVQFEKARMDSAWRCLKEYYGKFEKKASNGDKKVDVKISEREQTFVDVSLEYLTNVISNKDNNQK